jgi:alcohol dehydrogenase class IV
MSFNNRPPIQRQSIQEATAEAESRVLEYDPNVRARYIREMLRDIARFMAEGQSEDIIRQKVPDFIEKYPELFKKIINKQDLSPIQAMLAMLDKMGEGTINQHQASVIIGKKLVDRYVTPQLNGNGASK